LINLLEDTLANRKLVHRYIDVWEYPGGRTEARATESKPDIYLASTFNCHQGGMPKNGSNKREIRPLPRQTDLCNNVFVRWQRNDWDAIGIHPSKIHAY